MSKRLLMSPVLPFVVALSAAVTACDAPIHQDGGATPFQLLMPTIESLEPEPAAPGDEVTLRGNFHKLREDQGLFVSFNGIDSRQVTRVGDSVLRVVVPEGATSGKVVVVIGEAVGAGYFLKIRDKNPSD